VWEEVIRREGFGSTAGRTDLLFLNAKIIDEVGHLYSASSPEMHDTISVQDRFLGRFVSFLDAQVGKGSWVLCVTADHGHTAAPSVSGGFPIDERTVERLVDGRFDSGDGVALVRDVRRGWLYLSERELADAGLTPQEVAGYVRGLTKGQTARQITPPPSHRGDHVFASAFAGAALSRLPCLG
jgi:Type I phosphodiesterase / nucleotide pyrophosphatase